MSTITFLLTHVLLIFQKNSPAIIKGVAHRLRLTNMLDDDLRAAMSRFGGYLIASGYDENSIRMHFDEILQVSNRTLAFRKKNEDFSFKIALVTTMHPSLPRINKVLDKYYGLIKNSSVDSKILPRECLIAASRKLKPLSAIVTKNPFSNYTENTPSGFQQTPGCSCKLCKEGFFTNLVENRGRNVYLRTINNCQSKHVIYCVSCSCGLRYIGKTDNIKIRWANHKSHIRNGRKTCNFATHCIENHAEVMVGPRALFDSEELKQHIKFILLESFEESANPERLEKAEEYWRNTLSTWAPNGLNTREDGPTRLRRKKLNIS